LLHVYNESSMKHISPLKMQA